MPAWLDSTRMVDLVLVLVALELLAVLLVRPARFPWREWLPTLAAGAFLVLALRAAVHGAGVAWIGVALAAAGGAHLTDLLLRQRR